MKKFNDLTGQIFHRLTVIKFDKIDSKGHCRKYICKCQCGKIKSIRDSCLKRGETKSCGCIKSVHSNDYIDKLKERLLKHSVMKGECRVWTGKKSWGYGMTTFRNKNVFSHRAAYIVWKGEIPKGMFVCHNCPGGDNRECINPDHLFLGTAKDNVNDMIKKDVFNAGRYFKNTLNKEKKIGGIPTKITKEMLEAISENMRSRKKSGYALAKIYGISKTTIFRYVNKDGSLKEKGKKLFLS